MKLRIAKKILFGKSSYSKRCRQLRPSSVMPDGNINYPSWHDIDRVRRARTVFLKWAKKNMIIKITKIG